MKRFIRAGLDGRKPGALAFLAVAVFASLWGSKGAQAQNAVFQNFFTSVCTGAGASGALATRCAQTGGGTGSGNIAGDSESSLNPTQALSGADGAIAQAQALAAETLKRLEEIRDEEADRPTAPDTAEIMEFAGLSVSLQLEGQEFDRDRKASDLERGYEGSLWGGRLGVDYRLTDSWVVGSFLGFARTNSEFDADLNAVAFSPAPSEGGTDSDAYSVNLFSSYGLTDNWYIDGSLGFAYTDYTFRRDVVFLDSTRTIPQTRVITEGETDGVQYTVGGGTGYDFAFGPVSLGPYVRATYARTEINSYDEGDLNGSGLAMAIGEDAATSLTGVVGARASFALSTGWGVIVPQARLEFEHEFRDDPRSVQTRFLNDLSGTTFSVRTDSPDRNYFNVGASLLIVLPNGWMPFVDYEALVGYRDLDRTTITGGLKVEF